MNSKKKYDLAEVEYAIRNLYVDLKIKNLFGESKKKTQIEEFEKVKDLNILKLIDYLKQLIEIYINYNVEKALSDSQNRLKYKSYDHSDVYNNEDTSIENNEQAYELIIRNLEEEIRNHVKIRNELKIQNEDLIAKIYKYEDSVSDKKENEIFILKAENRILKTTIEQMEEEMNLIQESFASYKVEIKEIMESNKIIIENLENEIKNYQNFIENELNEDHANFSSKDKNYNKSNSDKIINKNIVKFTNKNNQVYKISYVNVNSNMSNSNDSEKENNKLAQSTNANINISDKLEIYKNIFEKLKSLKFEKVQNFDEKNSSKVFNLFKNSFQDIKRCISAIDNQKYDGKIKYDKIEKIKSSLTNKKIIDLKDLESFRSSSNKRVEYSHSIYNLRNNDKNPFSYNSNNIKTYDVITPNKNSNSDFNKNEAKTENLSKKNLSILGFVTRRISSTSNLSNLKKISKDSFGEKIKSPNSTLKKNLHSNSKTKKLNFKNIKNFSSIKSCSISNN